MQHKEYFYLAAGILLSIFTVFYYLFRGYSWNVLLLWLVSLLLAGTFFFLHRAKSKTSKDSGDSKLPDLYLILALLLVFTPLYLYSIYNIPVQVSSDEIVIMSYEKELTANQTPDIFGLSNYYNYPAFIFIIFGLFGKLLGGINLLNMRIVHAVSGLLIIFFCYMFFRSFTSRIFAFGAAVLVGSNHALLGISRLALRDNSALLVQLAALTLLFTGYKRKCPFYSFLGGVVGGLSFYNYLPGRFTMALWLLFLLLLAVRSKAKLPALAKITAISLLGFGLVLAPLIAATIKSPQTEFDWVRTRMLIFPEGQDLQKEWVYAPTVGEGIKINTIRGITLFNNNVYDQNNVYVNFGHGFVDPLTGVLVWVGFVLFLFKPIKKDEDYLVAGSFLMIWLILGLLFNKAPHYNSLLIILPFVAFLTIEASKSMSGVIPKLLKSALPISKIAFIIIIASIFLWNMLIFADFVKTGIAHGDDIGSTARYVEARKNIQNYSFILLANKEYPYYSWGDAYGWKARIMFFAGDQQNVKVVSPDDLTKNLEEAPLTVFMSQKLWLKINNSLTNKFPDLKIHDIKPDSSLIAIEAN